MLLIALIDLVAVGGIITFLFNVSVMMMLPHLLILMEIMTFMMLPYLLILIELCEVLYEGSFQV
jgi:hypothetical protein